jgi:hypothetical protein
MKKLDVTAFRDSIVACVLRKAFAVSIPGGEGDAADVLIAGVTSRATGETVQFNDTGVVNGDCSRAQNNGGSAAFLAVPKSIRNDLVSDGFVITLP